jgi:hypothetical protein
VISIDEFITTALSFTNLSRHRVHLTTVHRSSPLAQLIAAFSDRAISSSRASRAPPPPPSRGQPSPLLVRYSQAHRRDWGELLVLTALPIWSLPVSSRRTAAHRATVSSSPSASQLPPPSHRCS